ncbi:MAG: tellurite resistance TerB family protein [Pseudomonadota bacterium]
MTKTISTHHALIYVMVTTAGVQGDIGDRELKAIGRIVKQLPIFRAFDAEKLTHVAQECGEILQDKEGLEAVFGLAAEALTPKLRETAYALAVEIAASDLAVGKEELRFLAMLRDHLGLDKLVTAAIERGAIARYQTE